MVCEGCDRLTGGTGCGGNGKKHLHNIEDEPCHHSSTPSSPSRSQSNGPPPRFLVSGDAAGPLLWADTPLSFWGGVDPATGTVIDVHHPLHGEALSSKVLAIPYGRGSCSGSLGVLECIAGGNGPAAIVLAKEDHIIALGALVGQVVFGKSIPVLVVGQRRFDQMENGGAVHITASRFKVVNPSTSMIARLRPPGDVTLDLSDSDKSMLSGEKGEAVKQAMELVVAMAKLYGAKQLIDVGNAHIDACIYVGPASLRFAEHFSALDARFAVPTTLNAISIDRRRWSELGVDPTFATEAAKLADAYLSMGASEESMTCAPYLLPSAPKQGDQVVWAESNAVVFANSVLGARTQKYPDMLDVIVALTGRAPEAGPHISANRAPTIRINIDPTIVADQTDSALWALLGYAVGLRAGREVAIVSGLEACTPRLSDLKAFGAAFGTTASAPMFHIVGITPEASEYDAKALPAVDIDAEDMWTAWDKLNSATDASVGLVAFGNPHLSLDEFEELATLMAGKRRCEETKVILTASRRIVAEANTQGYLEPICAFGAEVVTDTCWCMLSEPVIPSSATNIMTNSAKYAHYGAGATGKGMHFGTTAACVHAACTGRNTGTSPGWLGNRSKNGLVQ